MIETGNHDIKLAQGVFLVEGVKRAALYDTSKGNVYSVNDETVDVLKGRDLDLEFISNLVSLGLVSRNQESTNSGSHLINKSILQPNLHFAWLEITERCNERCLHCYGDFSPQIKSNFRALKYADWKNVITDLHETGCTQIQFIGGEPFMYRDGTKSVLDLAEFAKKLSFDFIEIFTNGTLVSVRDIERAKECNVQMAISIYSMEDKVHDAITQVPGSLQKTLKTIKVLQEAEVPIRGAVILMKQNEEDIEQTIRLVRGLGIDVRSPDVVRPSGRANSKLIEPSIEAYRKYGLINEPNFHTDPDSFDNNHFYHQCLAGKIAVTTNGKVILCIFSRSQIVGDLKEQTIAEILQSSSLKEKWELTKDKVLVCQDCEYRYVCFDCRPLAEGSSCSGSYSTAPYPRCSYNPYLGEWGDGWWKMNENGEVLYKKL